jgi:hypothetical protein
LRSPTTANIKIALLLILIASVLHSILPTVISVDASRPALGNLHVTAGSGSITVLMTSPQQINGVAGQFVKVTGIITNAGLNDNVSGLAYISLLDTQNRAPLDLEDWSASRGIYVSSIAHGQSVSVEWDVRLVKAGSYSIAILFSQDGVSPPIASSKILLEVAPKRNLNPDNVLPVAFGTPALLIGIFLAITFIRGKKMGIYS